MGIVSDTVDMFFGTQGDGSIAGIRLDATLNDNFSLASTVTQWTVEQGSPVSDAIIAQSPVLSIEGVITNANIVLLDGLLTTGLLSIGENKLNAARAQLYALQILQEPVTLVTSNVTYRGYGMQTCSISRRGGGQDGELTISATFIQIRKATLQTTTVSLTNVAKKMTGKAGATKAAAGAATTTTQPDTAVTAKASSIAYSLLFGNK